MKRSGNLGAAGLGAACGRRWRSTWLAWAVVVWGLGGGGDADGGVRAMGLVLGEVKQVQATQAVVERRRSGTGAGCQDLQPPAYRRVAALDAGDARARGAR